MDSCTLYLSYHHRLQRTSEFSVYGHGQQRRAIIEAVRLYEEGKNGNSTSGACESVEGLSGAGVGAVCPEYAKDRSKKWQKYVTQVDNHELNNLLYCLLMLRVFCLSHLVSLNISYFQLFLHFRQRLPVELRRSAVRWEMR